MSFFGVDIIENKEDYLYQLTYYGLSKFIYDTGMFKDLNIRGVHFFKSDMYVIANLKLGYKNEYYERLKFMYYVEQYIKKIMTKYSLKFKYEISDAKYSDSLIELEFKVTPATTFREVFKLNDTKINTSIFQPNTYCNDEIQYNVCQESKYLLNLSETSYPTYDNFLGEQFQRFIMRHSRLSKVVCQWKYPYDVYAPIYENFSKIVQDIPLFDEVDIEYPNYPSYLNRGISNKSLYCLKVDLLSDIPWNKTLFEKTLREFWNEELIKKDFYGDVCVDDKNIYFTIPSSILKQS